MRKKATTLLDLARIRAENWQLLQEHDHLGTALGRKNFDPSGQPNGDPCIIIYTREKIAINLLGDRPPFPRVLVSADKLMEAPTDIVVAAEATEPFGEPWLTASNRDLIRRLRWQDGRQQHIGPGVQIGGAILDRDEIAPYEGTVGYVVREKKNRSRIGILTNQHLGTHPGQSLYVPKFGDLRLGVTRRIVEWVPDDSWLDGVDEPFAFVRGDAAFVLVEKDLRGKLANINEALGPLGELYRVALDSMDLIGKPVKKVGRTTGLQTGTIIAFGYRVFDDDQIIDQTAGSRPANHYTDFLIAPRGESEFFSYFGDSGSPIVLDTYDDDHNRPLGLLWGGGPADVGRRFGLEDFTYGVDLANILDYLELEIVPSSK